MNNSDRKKTKSYVLLIIFVPSLQSSESLLFYFSLPKKNFLCSEHFKVLKHTCKVFRSSNDHQKTKITLNSVVSKSFQRPQ